MYFFHNKFSRGAKNTLWRLTITRRRVAFRASEFVAAAESPSREEKNCRREVAVNKILSLKNPGALSRGHLINNDVEKPARRCSLERAWVERTERRSG